MSSNQRKRVESRFRGLFLDAVGEMDDVFLVFAGNDLIVGVPKIINAHNTKGLQRMLMAADFKDTKKLNHMRRSALFILAMFTFSFSFCGIKTKNAGEQVPKDSTAESGNLDASVIKDTVGCGMLLVQLFRSSDFEVAGLDKNKLDVYVNDVEDSVAVLKVFYTDEHTKHMPLGWLHLNLKDKKLYDVTNDPEAPRLVKYDTAILDSIMANCVFYGQIFE